MDKKCALNALVRCHSSPRLKDIRHVRRSMTLGVQLKGKLMALIDTDKIAQQFGQQAAKAIEEIASGADVVASNFIKLLETKDLVITIRLQDRM